MQCLAIFIRLFAVSFVLLSGLSAAKGTPTLADNTPAHISKSLHIKKLRDIKSIEEALEASAERALPVEADTIDHSEGTWLQLTINRALQTDHREDEVQQLITKKRGTWRYVVYQAPLYKAQRFNTAQPSGGAFFPAHSPVDLTKESIKGAPIYIHVELGKMDHVFGLTTKTEMLAENQFFLGITVAQRAVMLFIFLFAIFLWYRLNMRVFMLYAAFVLTNALSMSFEDSSLFYLPFMEVLTPIGHELHIIVAVFAYVAGISFLTTYLDLWKRLRYVAYALLATQILCVPILVAPLFGGSAFELRGLVNLIFLIGICIVIFTAIYMALYMRTRRVLYTLVGWSIYYCSVMLLLFSAIGLMPESYYHYVYFQIGILAELAVFQAGMADLALSFRQERDTAMSLAVRDPLTRCYNRQGLQQVLPGIIAASQDCETGFAVALIDIDHFKQVNDTYGHDAGDICLTEVAQCIQKQLRGDDILVRYGGEEFLILLQSADQSQAVAICERIRVAISEQQIHIQGERSDLTLAVTVSLGLAEFRTDIGFEPVLKKADEALYRSKENGRNQLTLAPLAT